MSGAFKRVDRLKALFLEELTQAVRELKDPGLSGFLTITDVELTDDLKEGKVFYSMLGSPVDKELAGRALERATGFLHKRLFDALSIRRIPKLSFHYDETPEKAQRVETLLARIHEEEGAPPPAPPAQLDSVASKSFQRRRRRR